MTTTPRISIGLPVFNGDKYLCQTLDSIAEQSLADYELIIADNASDDCTQDICRNRASKDSRIRYIRNPVNLGATANYNLVFRASETELFKWSSANDLLNATFLSSCVEILDKNPNVVLSYPRTFTFDTSLETAVPYLETLDVTSASAYERFRNVLDNIRLNNVMNGVARTSALRGTRLHGQYYSSDICLVADLSLRGELHEATDAVLYRRMSWDARVDSANTDRALAHWAPGEKKSPKLQNWAYLLELTRSAITVRPGIADTLRCLGYTGQLAYLSKRQLASELWDALRSA